MVFFGASEITVEDSDGAELDSGTLLANDAWVVEEASVFGTLLMDASVDP